MKPHQVIKPNFSIKTFSKDPVAEELQYKVVSDQFIGLSRQLAYDFLEYERFDGERDVREGHVQYLYNEYHEGRFMWHHVILAAAVLYEKLDPSEPPKQHVYRINGQHTCWMRVMIPEKDEPVNASKVRKIVYAVENREQLRNLYATFDRAAPRTPGHITKVMLLDSGSVEGISPSYLTPLVAGFRVWEWEGKWERQNIGTPANVAALIKGKYAELFNMVGKYFKEMSDKATFVRRSPVIGALFATFQKSPEESTAFWDGVFTGLGLTEENDPRYQLRKFLESHSMNLSAKRDALPAEDMFRTCINAWNRWRKKEKISVVRTTDTRQKVL